MDSILELSEEDIKNRYITPAIEKAGWKKEMIRMEHCITDGQLRLRGSLISRDKPKKADYVLFYNHNPIALIEAKSAKKTAGFGLQQAIEYAKKIDVPFAYSSNGSCFIEHDFLSGRETEIPIQNFPSAEELFTRLTNESHNGNGLSSNEIMMYSLPYYTGAEVKEPRYYQRIAVDRVLNAIARNQNRLLLVMATGTGKTLTAFQIIYRLLASSLKKRVLYLADRNILVDQSISQDFKPLEKTCHKVDYSSDKKKLYTLSSYQVHFALYQQLVGEDNKENYKDLYRPDFFDFIVVDECHRGSAKNDSKWKKILEYFSQATQLGMTATPKETKYTSNIHYFGEPVFTYSLKDGIQDGFLAPFKVVKTVLNISDGWRPTLGQTDAFGNPIEDRIYNNTDYDYNIVLVDRTKQVAFAITQYLKKIGRMSKTIVFCADEDHADRMRQALVNENSDECKKNSDYVVRITGSDDYGKSKLKEFISLNSKYPVIATTSDLLSTGVDCKTVKLIVLDQVINSMTKFKQIVGRGTRLNVKFGKDHFTIMDFRGVTKLFADPDWDGDIEQDENFDPNNKQIYLPPPQPQPPVTKPYVDENGCKVEIIQEAVFTYDVNGKLLSNEDIIDYTRKNILGKFSSLKDFILRWKNEDKKEKIRDLFLEKNIDISELKKQRNMSDVDDFDFICHIAYDKKPLTRKERYENVKKQDFISKYNSEAQDVIRILMKLYADKDIYEMEDVRVLDLDEFKPFGTKSKIVKMFGSIADYKDAIRDIESKLYEDDYKLVS